MITITITIAEGADGNVSARATGSDFGGCSPCEVAYANGLQQAIRRQITSTAKDVGATATLVKGSQEISSRN